MKNFWNYLFIISLLFSCKSKESNIKITDFIPENATTILKLNTIESLKSNLNNNDLLQNISNSKIYNSLTQALINLDSLNLNNETLICFSRDELNNFHHTIISKISNDSLKIDSTKLANQKFYKLSDGYLIIASNKTLLDASLKASKNNNSTNKILISSSNNKSFSLDLKNDNSFLKSFFINDSLHNIKLTGNTLFDADISQDALLFNGITKASDSLNSLINIFKNTFPQENEMSKITPSNADGFMSFTFDDFSTLKNNLEIYTKNDNIPDSRLFDFISEIGVIYENNKRAIVLKSLDWIATQEALNEQNTIKTYRQISIYSFAEASLFADTFSPLINYKKATKYCIINSFLIFSDDIEMLQNIIANYQNKTTLNDRSYYQNLKTSLSDDASLMMVINAETLSKNLNNNLDENLNLSLKEYKNSAIQFIYENDYAHTNIVIKKSKTKARENSITEQFNIALDTDLLNHPQFVTNHINKQKDIVVQDINNQLYLISNTGKILWKKQLQGEVLGNIQQIDIYKNGRLQLAFATPNHVYVLDRKGKNVSPFPLKFNDKITQPLSVFEYDKNRKYRLVVTQGKNVIMYDVKGQTVKGFTFKKAESNIVTQPQHFIIGSKDYLVFKTKNKIYIINRTGEKRVRPKKSFNYSNEAVYIYNNKFTTTTKKGKLISIDRKGNTATQNLGLTNPHHIATTSKTLVTLSENKLTIRGKTVELDFGNYTAPEIFILNNKLYITITDLQTQKVFVYDSQAKLQTNFPMYATSQIDFANADKDKALEFVCKGGNNSIILYQIN
jgi:hypothetical protein